jgi:hypothetical protein
MYMGVFAGEGCQTPYGFLDQPKFFQLVGKGTPANSTWTKKKVLQRTKKASGAPFELLQPQNRIKGHKINNNNKFVLINTWGWCTGAPILNFMGFSYFL